MTDYATVYCTIKVTETDLPYLVSPFRSLQLFNDKEKDHGNVTSWLYEMKTAAFLYAGDRNFNFLEKTKTGSASYRSRRKSQEGHRDGKRKVEERVGCIRGIPPTRSSTGGRESFDRVYDIPPTVWFVSGKKKERHVSKANTNSEVERMVCWTLSFKGTSMIDRFLSSPLLPVTFQKFV